MAKTLGKMYHWRVAKSYRKRRPEGRKQRWRLKSRWKDEVKEAKNLSDFGA